MQGLSGLSHLAATRTRSISAENPDGAKGSGGMATEGTGAHYARDLGPGWKVSPFVVVEPKSTTTLAVIEGPGCIQHLWITVHPKAWRTLVLRCYWDGEGEPAVEVPLGDFFGQGWGEFAQLSSLPVAANSYGGLNSYWEMPFRRSGRITLENLSTDKADVFFQLTYALGEVPPESAYFHATWRRSNPLPTKEVHPILDGVTGAGHYVGTYLAWGSNSTGWWGEGEVKFYLDGDGEFPTICGTGTEDYVGGAWCFRAPDSGYLPYTTPFLGFHQVIRPDGLYSSQTRFGMYRWHIPDPIRFETDLRVTVQALGWRAGDRYLALQDDISSTALWYQREAHGTGHRGGYDADLLEVV